MCREIYSEEERRLILMTDKELEPYDLGGREPSVHYSNGLERLAHITADKYFSA